MQLSTIVSSNLMRYLKIHSARAYVWRYIYWRDNKIKQNSRKSWVGLIQPTQMLRKKKTATSGKHVNNGANAYIKHYQFSSVGCEGQISGNKAEVSLIGSTGTFRTEIVRLTQSCSKQSNYASVTARAGENMTKFAQFRASSWTCKIE